MIIKEKLIDLKHEHFNQHTGSYFDVDSMLRKIYDSIGSCGECKHYSLLDGACKLHSEDTGAIVTMMNHDFCSYFERKELCGT